jgi:hypothetical protein
MWGNEQVMGLFDSFMLFSLFILTLLLYVLR